MKMMKKILNLVIFLTLIAAAVGLLVNYGINGSIFNKSEISTSSTSVDSFSSDSSSFSSKRIEIEWNNDVVLYRSDVGSEDKPIWWSTLLSTNENSFYFEVREIKNDYVNEGFAECESMMKNSVNELMKKSLYNFDLTPSFNDLFYLAEVEHGDNTDLQNWQGSLVNGDATAGKIDDDVIVTFTISGELYDLSNNLVKTFRDVTFGFKLFYQMPL